MVHPMPARYGTTATRWGEQRAAERDAVIVDRSNREVITLSGADRLTWLHSLCTQHVAELPDGACTENLSLDGQGRWRTTGSRRSPAG